MIHCKELNKDFDNKEQLFEALRANKSALIAQKKMQTKEADSLFYISGLSTKGSTEVKASIDNLQDVNKLSAMLVINTTNILDSHGDVHLKGIWNKSVKEAKNLLLLQEHKMTFDHIVSDSIKASINEMTWKELGFNFQGTTEALMFNAEIEKGRNEFMFNQYAKGFVKEHSVGMRYVKLELALNSDSKWDEEEKVVWDKYINDIVNKQDAESLGYFWAVSEAKIVEGSAVVKGSNYATPTMSIEAAKGTLNIEPSNDTQKTQFYSHLI